MTSIEPDPAPLSTALRHRLEQPKQTFELVEDPSWPNGQPDLSGQTIDTLIRGIKGSERLGDFKVAESVPYPMMGQYVVEAVKCILDYNIIERYILEERARSRAGVNTDRGTREDIPIHHNPQEVKDAPTVKLNLSHAPPDVTPAAFYRGVIVSIDQKGKAYPILTFYPI